MPSSPPSLKTAWRPLPPCPAADGRSVHEAPGRLGVQAQLRQVEQRSRGQDRLLEAAGGRQLLEASGRDRVGDPQAGSLGAAQCVQVAAAAEPIPRSRAIDRM